MGCGEALRVDHRDRGNPVATPFVHGSLVMASEGRDTSDERRSGHRSFPTTRWSLVLAAGDTGPMSEDALESLCQIYWPAVYAYVRHRGCAVDQAEDLTQVFSPSSWNRTTFDRRMRSGKVPDLAAEVRQTVPRQRVGPCRGREAGWWPEVHPFGTWKEKNESNRRTGRIQRKSSSRAGRGRSWTNSAAKWPRPGTSAGSNVNDPAL